MTANISAILTNMTGAPNYVPPMSMHQLGRRAYRAGYDYETCITDDMRSGWLAAEGEATWAQRANGGSMDILTDLPTNATLADIRRRLTDANVAYMAEQAATAADHERLVALFRAAVAQGQRGLNEAAKGASNAQS